MAFVPGDNISRSFPVMPVTIQSLLWKNETRWQRAKGHHRIYPPHAPPARDERGAIEYALPRDLSFLSQLGNKRKKGSAG